VTLAQQAKHAKESRPSSAKIRMILNLLKEVDERSQGEEKTIVFSQFTKMLDLIEPFLNEKGIKYVRCKSFFKDLKARGLCALRRWLDDLCCSGDHSSEN
jgi:ERCC4-related helicase